MIYELKIRNPKLTPVPHWNKVAFLKGKESFEFKPGLNIIYGPNGSGKSTLLTALAILTHTWQTNWPRVTKDSLMLFNRPVGFADGLLMEHDGSPARYLGVEAPSFAPKKTKTSNLTALKIEASAKNKALHNMSHGQASVVKLVRFLRATPEGIHYAMSSRKATDEWEDLYELGTESLKNKSKRRGMPKQQVILLDEVDRSLDFVRQAAVWKQIRLLSTVHQIIIASHSPFATYAPNAHYIETEDNYLRNSRLALAKLPEMAEKIKKSGG